MRWIGTWLMLATLKVTFAMVEETYEWYSEDNISSDIRVGPTKNWRRRPDAKRSPNADEEFFLNKLCSPEDPVRLYDLVEQIGEGAFGKVYRGKRKSDGKKVAIKTLAMDHYPDMLIRELRALHIVTHAPGRPRSLPMMYAAYKDVTDAKAGISSKEPHRKRLWIVMDFIEGVTIPVSIKKDGYFEMGQARTIMKQVMDTLCFIHNEHRLIHGDLIPQNIILSSRHQLEVKFVDFGLSRIVGESGKRSIAWELGKAGEMAYRLRFGYMPTYINHDGREERMHLPQLCDSPHLTSKIPRDLLSFMKACLKTSAEACQLKDHAFLRDSRRKILPYYDESDSDDDQYDVEDSWFNRIAERDLYR